MQNGCGTQPSCKFEGQSRPLYCTKCKKDAYGGCGTQPSCNYNFVGHFIVLNVNRMDVTNVVSKKCKGGCGTQRNHLVTLKDKVDHYI
eukprot:Pgem_evm1s3605